MLSPNPVREKARGREWVYHLGMPSVKDYRKLAPFTSDELIDAANSLLRSKPGFELTKRTLRYYVSTGVLPPPQGTTRQSRYAIEHLAALVAVRSMQYEGLILDKAKTEVERALGRGPDAAVALADYWLDHRPQIDPSQAQAMLFQAKVSREGYMPGVFLSRSAEPTDLKRLSRRSSVETVQRIRLSRGIMLEVSGRDLNEALEEALRAIEKLIDPRDRR